MSEQSAGESEQFDYPVRVAANHRAVGSTDYGLRDRFECAETRAYIHTGGWPAFEYCPFCGQSLKTDTKGGETA